jgi:rod shape-determining protein MreC
MLNTKGSRYPLLSWLSWLGLSLISLIIIVSGKSYPAQVFRSSMLTVLRYPLYTVSWIPVRINLKQENRELRQRGIELLTENCRLRELALEALRLQEMLDISRRADMIYFPVRVISRGNPLQAQTLVVEKGLSDGIRGGEALVTPWGMAGSIIEPALNHSRAQLLTHQDFSVRALVQRTRNEGILTGGYGRLLRLMDIPLSSEIMVGDQVISSGKGSRYAGGIPIGLVVSVRESGGLFKDVVVKPLVDLENLEELFIVQPVSQDSVMVSDLSGIEEE